MTQFTIHFTDGTSAAYHGHYISTVPVVGRHQCPWAGWVRIMQHEVSEKTGKRLSKCYEVVRFNGALVKSIESFGDTHVELVGAPV